MAVNHWMPVVFVEVMEQLAIRMLCMCTGVVSTAPTALDVFSGDSLQGKTSEQF